MNIENIQKKRKKSKVKIRVSLIKENKEKKIIHK